MKKVWLASGMIALIAFSACKKDDVNTDTTAPVIGVAEGRASIRPENNEVRASTTDHMHVRFGVKDDSGINQVLIEVHNSFDGHSHGKTSNFSKLDYRRIIQANGAKSINIDSPFDDIFWGGPNSEVQGNVLAGPYDFIIAATDIHGNQTSYGNNTNYIARIVIERDYALAVEVTNLVDDELEGDKNQPLDVKGTIAKTTHTDASNIAFVWVTLGEEHEHKTKSTQDELIYERMWGTSMWRANMSGPSLPSGTSINLENLFSGSDAIVLPNETGHFELVIWVEDVNGNITEKHFEVHVD